MSHEKPRSRSRRSGIEAEEERVWVDFYQCVGRDAAAATEVLAQLESDSDMKHKHLALYLCCKKSLRQYKARQQRNKRVGQFVRWLGHGLFIRPLQRLRETLRQGNDIAVECLPEMSKEAAVVQVRRLTREAEVATTRMPSTLQAGEPAAAPAAAPPALSGTKISRAAV